MEIYAKAKELAEALANSAELAAVKEAELKMMMDNDARAIVEEYQTIQMNAMNSGLRFEDLSQEQKNRVILLILPRHLFSLCHRFFLLHSERCMTFPTLF